MAADPDGRAKFVIPQPVGVPDRPGLLDLTEELIEIGALVADHDDRRWIHPRRRPVIVSKVRADDRWQPATVEVERPRLAVVAGQDHHGVAVRPARPAAPNTRSGHRYFRDVGACTRRCPSYGQPARRCWAIEGEQRGQSRAMATDWQAAAVAW